MMVRQVADTHRPFEFHVFDNNGKLVLVIKRGFQLINSHVKVMLPDGTVVGQTSEKWSPLKRKCKLFQASTQAEFKQFGYIEAPLLSWDFSVGDSDGFTIGAVDRNWTGLARELYTNTNMYILRMDPIAFQPVKQQYAEVKGPMTVDQRAVLLANAISIDFDYFSQDHDR